MRVLLCLALFVAALEGQRLDQGPVHPSFRLPYVTLHTQLTAAQQRDLDNLLADQQNPASRNYLQWLTPEQFADRFGLPEDEFNQIADWLESEGFQIVYRSRSRTWLAFSGTAQQVGQTFRTSIRRVQSRGESHFANAVAPTLPAALAGHSLTVSGLNDFRPHPHVITHPDYTQAGGGHYLAPDDLATIYNLNPLYNAGINGSGQKVAIVGQTAVNLSDLAAFRSIFNLAPNPPQLILVPGSPDPGVRTGDIVEAELDLEWIGAVARNANVLYVYADDVFTSVRYTIDNHLAQVLSMSYGACEIGLAPSDMDSFRLLAQQANAQGITWVAASGDAGPADCDWNPGMPAAIATQGYAVDIPSSIPEVTAVGGTEFNEVTGAWSPSNGLGQGSALGYLTERAWNDTGPNAMLAGGGGTSKYYPIPSWQIGLVSPATSFRSVPDVALTASPSHDGFIVCVPGRACPSGTWSQLGPGSGFATVGGTSAAAPVFAGLLGLLNHSLVLGGGQAGVGNANPVLYRLSQSNPSAFHDITSGDNIVPCQLGTPDCATGFIGFRTIPGYDLATGLGSVDGYNLIQAWTSLHLLQPSVDTAAASPVAATAATLRGSANPHGAGTTAWFEYSRSSSLLASISTPKQDLGQGNTAVPFGADLTGLSPGTYYYQAWASNSLGTIHGSLASFSTIAVSTTNVTFETSPPGLPLTVDGTSRTTPFALQLITGTHSVTVTSPLIRGGIRNTFQSWSDGQTLAHAISVTPSAATYTATFQTAYLLTVSAVPAAAAIVSASSGYVNAGSIVPLSVTPSSTFQFANWAGGVANRSSANTTVTMTAPLAVTANLIPTSAFFVRQLYRDLLSRDPDPAGLAYWKGHVDNGILPREVVASSLFTSPEFNQSGLYVIKLYVGVLGRDPDFGGWLNWFTALRSGTTQTAVLNAFLASQEFKNTYGSLSNADFVTLVYRNVLNRFPDSGGFAFWVGQLNGGQSTRADVMAAFITGPEFDAAVRSRAYANLCYMGFLRRAADPDGLHFWTGVLAGNTPLSSVIYGFIYGQEYLDRLAALAP